MTNARQTGNRRERQARSIYNDAGYEVQAFYGRRYGETDAFSDVGLPCDFMAARRDCFVLAQVKSGYGSPGAWFDAAHALLPVGVGAHYLTVFEREGWRLLVRDGGGGYCVAFDERDSKVNMGAGLTSYLES